MFIVIPEAQAELSFSIYSECQCLIVSYLSTLTGFHWESHVPQHPAYECGELS